MPFVCDGGQAVLKRLRVTTGDLVVKPGAGQGEDVNGLLPAGHMEASAAAWLAL